MEVKNMRMKNETYIATAINTDKYKPSNNVISAPYKAYHFPSNPSVKGTEKIKEMLLKIENGIFKVNEDTGSSEPLLLLKSTK